MPTKASAAPNYVSNPDYPPYWSVKYLIAVESGDEAEARYAQAALKKLGYVIKPVAKNARAAV